MAEWKKVRIGDFLTRVKYPVVLDANTEYQLLTVRMHHKGVVPREKKFGGKIGSNMYQVKAGQFILSGIDARNGAFGVVPQELDGAIVTNDFWYFELNEDVVKRDFFYWLTSTPLLLNACIKSSEGTTNRRRLQRDRFFNFEFHIPKIERQIEILKEIKQKQEFQEKISAEITTQQTLLQKLRQAILQEAVQGKLTEAWRQAHPDVEPASELLKRIQAEKTQLIKEKKIKKQKLLPPIKDEEIPFELPEGWVWCRLGEIANNIWIGPFGSLLHKSDYIVEGIPLINPKHIKNGKIYPEDKFTVDKVTAKRLARYAVKNGDIIMARRGEMGRCSEITATENGWLCGTGSLVIETSGFINKAFLVHAVSSKYIKDYLNSSCIGQTMKNLNMKVLSHCPVALAPTIEQKTIVAEVDKLMIYYDQLEQQITQSQTIAEQLMQAVLREAFTTSA